MTHLSLFTQGTKFPEQTTEGSTNIYKYTDPFKSSQAPFQKRVSIISQVSLRRPEAAILTEKTRWGHPGLPEPLENVLSHTGDQQPFDPACKAWEGSPRLARLSENFPTVLGGPGIGTTGEAWKLQRRSLPPEVSAAFSRRAQNQATAHLLYILQV